MKCPSLHRRAFFSALAAFVCFASAGFSSGLAPERDQRRFEVRFLTSMIDHHYGAIKMAELCAGRVVHPELGELCDAMKTAQTAEIATMQGWLHAWYGVTHEPTLDRKMAKQITLLSQRSGASFEKAFMRMMIYHHAEAIARGRECLLEAYHAEMLAMCAQMLAAQGEEITMMRLWLMQWYEINDLDPRDHA